MNKKTILIASILLVVFFMLASISNFYTDYLWFKVNHGLNIFWVLFTTKFFVHFLFGLIFAGLFGLNFLLIRVLGGKGRIFSQNILDRLKLPVVGSPRKILVILLVVGVLVLAYIMGQGASVFWKEYLMATHSVPFAGFPKDPVFNLDIGFYVFSLPFYQFLYGWLMTSLFMIAAFSIFFHVINGGILVGEGQFEFSLFSRTHISALLASLVLLYGFGYRLSAYELLFSKIGKFYGAGYTAIHANLLAFNVAMWISFIAAALLLLNIVKKSFKLPVIVLAILLPVYFVLSTLWPSALQRFVVQPNELGKEKPYIQNNIKFTRIGFDLNRIKEIKFENKKKLTYKDIVKNNSTIENVRLWDWIPLKQTYKQLQELKPYYFFNDVDVDRYIINKKKVAVNLSARELSVSRLSANSQSWQNSKLIYTHGYGAVMSRVDKITSEGLPEMIIKDIPPVSSVDIKLDSPQIYYGESKNSYVLTNTSIKPGEFDYPSGDKNKYTTYAGNGGIKLDSFFKKLMFALSMKDINILISGDIKDNSRILYKRNINEIVQTLTPFIDFDGDPYLVISKGKLFWIIDGYTSTDKFPYSTPISLRRKNINYIRNSIKITIDAYNGTTNYYMSDKGDPIIKAYNKIFPGLFKNFNDIPENLKKHVRYPEDIFNIQSKLLLRYHMLNPNVFYNNEDGWDIPKQIYESSEELVRSYYLVTKLPDENDSEFISIMPFTPYKKNNMIAFFVAKCDHPNYGEMKLYILPKDKLSYGPLQIEARIDQNPDISKQLTLWSQKGSGVIRGNMLVIPIEQSLLFIEPLYLKAESSEMPELKRVIVAFGDKIVMEKNLNLAIEKIFFNSDVQLDSGTENFTVSEKIKNLSKKALIFFKRAEKSSRAGDWAAYGKELQKLKQALIEIKRLKK